jgi:hypothetical protein
MPARAGAETLLRTPGLEREHRVGPPKRPASRIYGWSSWGDSNSRPLDPQFHRVSPGSAVLYQPVRLEQAKRETAVRAVPSCTGQYQLVRGQSVDTPWTRANAIDGASHPRSSAVLDTRNCAADARLATCDRPTGAWCKASSMSVYRLPPSRCRGDRCRGMFLGHAEVGSL